jgi:copper transport protein
VQAREALSAAYDGESAAADPAAVDSHLDACPACAAYRGRLPTITALALPASPPPGLTAAVLRHHPIRQVPASRPTVLTRALALAILATVVAVVVLLVAARPASAHATLRASTPAADAVLAAPPSLVDLTFSEPITLLPDSVRVFGPDGSRVDTGGVGHSHGDAATAAVALRADLSEGTYLVSYRVVSADSHPIAGAYTFAVGHASATPSASAGEGGSDAVDLGLGVSRWLSYAGAALGLGGFAFLVWCWPAGWGSRQARRLVIGGVGSLVAGTLLALVLKGPYDEGSGLARVTDGPLLRQVLATTYGQALDARLLMIAVLVLLVTYRDQLPRRALVVAPAAVLIGVGVTFALCGHAAAGGHRPIAIASDSVHVAAMSIWMGGLAMLLGAVLVRRARDEATQVVLRFSTLATGAVTALVVTGTYQTLREVRSWDVLFHSHYGHVLLVKLGIVALALLAAAASRTGVWQTENPVVAVHAATAAPPTSGTDDPDDTDGRPQLRRLRVSVALETLLLTGVLVATALLVTSDPARSSEPSGPVVRTVSVGPDRVRVSAVPDGTRRVAVTLQVTDAAGRATEPKEVDASLTLTSHKIGPMPITLESTGRGRRTGDVTVPLPGTWRLAVTVRTSAIDEETAYVDVPVG